MSDVQWSGPPASHPLDSTRGKLVRAVQRSKDLRLYCDAYEEQHPWRFESHWDASSDCYIAFMRGRLPPMYLGLILGEVVHDLRSAFDHLAWAVAVEHVGIAALATPSAQNAVQFPITSTRARFDSHRALRFFSDEAVALMESFQPYHNAGSHLVHPLAAVQSLSNRDKHRALTPALGQIRLEEIEVFVPSGTSADCIEPLHPSDTTVDLAEPVLRVHLPEATPPGFGPVRARVCFGTDVTGQPDVIFPEKIEGLCGLVAEVFAAFEPLFPAVDWTSRKDSWVAPDLPA
jgi:hypothetical protein